MSSAPPQSDVREQLGRSRACIDRSERVIARSRERIDHSLGAIGRGAGAWTAARL